MPRDRLVELKDGTEQASVVIDVPEGQDMANMQGFFNDVDSIKEGIAMIKKKSEEIEQIHSKALSAVSEGHHDSKELDKLMDAANAAINRVRTGLKQMEAGNIKAGADPSNSSMTAEQRIRLSQHANLTKKFLECVTEYQDMQKNYKSKFKDRLERQFKIVKPNATAEEIEKVIETGADSNTMFAQQILMGPQHSEAKKALYDIQNRHEDIVKLEKSILELHQLFLDMAVLVNAQGEMINQIEKYTSSAADHTNKGVGEMRKAVKSQKKSRKKMCCLLFLIMAIIIIVIIVVSLMA